MKTVSIGHYVGAMGNVVLEQQTFIKKLLNTLQLLKPQSQEFTNQLNQLKEEFEEATNNHNLESNESMAEFDAITPKIQKDLEAIHVQLRVLKSANASSRKGQGQPDLTALEKNKKLKESFKEYKAESSLQISDIKSALSELKSELKNSHEMMTNIQANIQASRDEFDTFKSKVPTEDQKEEMNTTVNDMQVELEAIKTVLEVMHQGTATTEDLERVKKSQTRSVNILKNSMQAVKDEIKNIKLLKQGKIPTNVLDLVESLDQSVNSLQDEMEGIKKDVDDKSSILTRAQQDLVSLMSEMEKLKSNPIDIDTSSLPINDRINLIEDRINTIADHQLKAVNNYNAQRAYLKYFKEEFATDIMERVTELEKRMEELPYGDANANTADQKKSANDEYQHLDQKITQMINDLETSNIQERAVNISGDKPDFPHTVEELRTFQKALRAQAQDDENSIYQYIEPSNLPVVVQSMDQLVSEMYSEIYQIRDKLTSEISELKESSNIQTIKCLKHELLNVKNTVNGLKQQFEAGTIEGAAMQSDMQWPVLRSPGKKKEPSPFVEGLKSKIQDLVEDMNNAEDQEDDDINQIKPTMGEAQAKLNNMLTVCNNIIDQEVEDEIEQITPEKMWETINDLKSKVSSLEEKEEERLVKTRDIQLEEEEVDEVKEAIEELKKTSENLRYEIKQLKEKTETQEALEQIDEKMNSLTERINEISGHQSATESTINAHTSHIRQQANQIQDKLNQIEELEQTLNDFISTHHENDDQSIANMKAELEELKDQLTTLNQSHEEHGTTVTSQISEIHQKLKEFEEGAFFKSSPKANPVVQQLQKQIADLIKQMEDSQLKDEEDTTGELRPTFSQAQEQLETVQKTLDEILAQENERLMMESPSELVKNVQNLNNKVRMLEEGFSQSQNFEGLQQRSFSEEESTPSIHHTQTRAIDLTTDGNDKSDELVYELRNRVQVLENTVNRLNKQYKDATDLINKRHNSLKKVKATVNEKVSNRLDKIEEDLNHHITDHPVSQDIQVAVPPDSYIKSKPNPIIQGLKQQIDEVIQKIETEELENLASSEMYESGSHLKPELDQLKEQLTKLQEALRKLQEQQIYVPAAESLQGIADTISTLQDKVNNQSNIIRELKDQSDIKNNESLGQLKEEIKSLRNHVKTALQNEENLSNEVEDKLLPLSQKVEAIERRIGLRNDDGQDNFQESNIPLVERTVSDIYNSDTPNKKKSGNMTSIEALKTSIEQLVEKIDDDKLNEEEDTTGELKNNLGRTRKDLATLQTTLDSLIRKANDPAFLNGVSQEIRDLQSRVARLEGSRPIVQLRDIQLDGPNEEELNQLKENIEKLSTENEELKQDIKSMKYEIRQLKNKSPPSTQDNHNASINLDENDTTVDLLRQELNELRNELRNLTEQESNQENKVEQLQDQLNQINQSGFFSSSQPKRRQRSKAVFEIKDHVDNLLNNMSDPNIQEEAGDSEELRPSMDQAQEDLEKLQVTLNTILTQTEKKSAAMTPEGFYKLVTENQSEIHVLAENGQEVNKSLCELTETVRCIKHEMRKLKNDDQLGLSSIFKPTEREVNPAAARIQSQIDALSKQLDESDLTESDTKERDLNGKVTQTQEHLKSLREALQSILDADETEEITPENLVNIIRDLRSEGILMKQEIKDSQNTIDNLRSELQRVKDAQAEEPENSFEDRMSETIDKMRTRVDEVSASQIKTEENVKGQLQRLRDCKSEVEQVKSELSEIKEMLSSAEEWMCITDQTKPEENKASPLVESLTQQIDKLVEDLNKPDMQNQTSNNQDLEERRTQAQTQLSLLREALERAKEAQQEPLTFTPTSLLEAIKELRNKVAYLEFVDGQKIASREVNLEEEQADEENENQPIQTRGFPEKHYNPVLEEINEKINSLVQTLHHPDMEENDTNGEIQPQAAATENELRILRKEYDFLLNQEREMDALTPENLYKAICNLQVTAIRYEDSINSINCLKHEVKKLRHIELNNTNEQVQKLKRKSKDVRKKLNSHLEENQRIIDEINSPRKKKVNPAIEAVKREIETLNEKMNDPSFAEEEGNDGVTSGELSSRKQQAQQHLDLLSETLNKLLEQKEPAILNMDTLHQMIHDLQTKIAFLEAQNEQSAKETSEEMQNILNSMRNEVHNLREEQEVQTRDINLERDNKLNEIEEKINRLETRANEVTGSQQEVIKFVNAQKTYIDEFKSQQQSQKEQDDDIENRVSQLEQTVESIEEVSNSFVNLTPRMVSSRKINPKTEELKNQIDLIVSQMEDPSLLEDDTKDELNPAMDKAKDELNVLRDVLQHLADDDGNFSPAALLELESRVKALEEDKEHNIQTREINLESEEKVNNLSESLDTLKERLGNSERNEEEIKKNIDEVCKQVEDLQTRLGEVESQPSQIIAGFNTFKKRPINPSMQALKDRIDELVQQMNDPELQNEEENPNSKLKPSISKAETELRQLNETLNRLMEQEEPVGITPESLLALIHQLQAKVAELEVISSHGVENHDSHKQETQEKFENLNQDLSTFENKVNTISENQEKLVDQFNQFKSRLTNFEEQVSLKENEIEEKIGNMNENIDDIQSHITELETQPTQYLSGFPDSETLSRPVNPVIRGIQNRIDELVQEMNDPTLQDEDNKSNEELQTNMSNAESELQQLKATLKHLMEQEEPIVVTPEALLDIVHNLQAQVASLEASEDLRNQNQQKERTLNTISQNQAELIETFNNLKTNLDEFKNQLHDTNASGEEMDKNVDDLCQKIEETQNKIAEFEALPTPLQVSGFTTNTGSAAPVIQGIQKRIDELIKEMNHPTLQNEDNEANTQLKPSIAKAENELHRLQETLKKLEEEGQITPNKLYGMIQSTQDRCQGIEPRVENVESKVDEHIENHPVPEAEWTVMPREASQAVQDLKKLIDEICENMQVPVLDEDDETSSQLRPTIENAQTELTALQQKVNDILLEQEKPSVLTPDRIYHMILDLQSSVAKIRKEQIQQQRNAAREKAAKLAAQIEEEESENEDNEEFIKPTIKTRSIRNQQSSNIEDEIEDLKQSVAEIKSQLRQQQVSSPAKEYRNLKQFISNNPPKTEEELVSYIDRLQKVAQGFDNNILDAQKEIKKVGQIKNQLKEDGDFAKSLQQEIKNQSASIRCIKHELKLLKSGSVPVSAIKSRDVSLIVDDDDKKRTTSGRRRRNNKQQANQPSEEEQVKALQERLSLLEYNMDSLKLQYKGFDKQQQELENNANQTASYEALNTSINKFVERNNDSDSDEEVEKLHPDIENTQIKLRALKGSLDDVLNQQRQKELAIVTPQSLNADILDVKKHVEQTENDINEINDRIDNLDDNQEQAAKSFNDFKSEIDNSPKVTQEILDYIDDIPNQLAQIKSEIAQLKESHQNELSRLSQCINELTEEDKKKTESINKLNEEIEALKETTNKHNDEISNLHEKDSSILREVEQLKSTVDQNQQQNDQQFEAVNSSINDVKSLIEENQEQDDQRYNELKQNVSTINSNVDELKSTVEQNQQQNEQQFNQLNENVSLINSNIDELKSTVEQNQQQNEQQFNQLNENVSLINSNIDEVKSTVQQNQEQNEQQFNNIKENISTVTTEVDNLKTTMEQNQEQDDQRYNELKQNISTINSNVDEVKSTVEQNQQQNEQQFNQLNENINTINSNIDEVKSTVQQNQEQNEQQFNNIKENISTVTTEVDNLKTTIQQNQQQIQEVKDEISTLKQNLNEANENINNLVNQRKEDQKQVQNINNNVESLKTTTQNLNEEIENLKQSFKEKEDKQATLVTSQSKNIEYIQKVLSKHEKHLKALIEKEKGLEELFQQNDPVSKDDFSKLEMKYDKLIEQIHSNISVIANGQQSQQETMQKELKNLSQNNSELPSETSLGASHQNVDDLTKKVMKIFKHVKSQDEKINKLRNDVDGLINA